VLYDLLVVHASTLTLNLKKKKKKKKKIGPQKMVTTQHTSELAIVQLQKLNVSGIDETNCIMNSPFKAIIRNGG
jgi:hypothetical protein